MQTNILLDVTVVDLLAAGVDKQGDDIIEHLRIDRLLSKVHQIHASITLENACEMS